jgi:signal transduction histidine kinase
MQADAAARWATTARVSGELAEARDVELALPGILRLLVPGFADWCAVHLAERQGIRRAAIVHKSPDVEWQLSSALAATPFLADSPIGPARVMRTGESELVRDIAADPLRSAQPNVRQIQSITPLRSSVVVPLRARQQTIGALTLARGEPDGYDADDVEWAEDLGRRIGVTVEQRKLEDQLRQSSRLEAVGQLAGGIAHDFNNLLTVIIGCADLIRAEHPPKRPDDPIEELIKAATRAAGLTQQLLAFGRRQVLQPRVIDVNDAVRNIHSMLRRLVPDNISLSLSLAPDIEKIRVDPGQLDQVIVNLVVNAAEATAAGGTITIETSQPTFTADDLADRRFMIPGRYVSVAVRDTGVGMDDDTKTRAFEPFFTTKEVGKGTGLGLSTVYGIVKQSGGYIWVVSAPGAGTTVTVCFPPAIVPAASSHPETH